MTLLLYLVLLLLALHNIAKYLYSKQRYKVYPITVFYLFSLLLCFARVVQHSESFKYYMNTKIAYANSMADGFSICIGLSQLLVVLELILTIRLYKVELVTDDEDEVIHRA